MYGVWGAGDFVTRGSDGASPSPLRGCARIGRRSRTLNPALSRGTGRGGKRRRSPRVLHGIRDDPFLVGGDVGVEVDRAAVVLGELFAGGGDLPLRPAVE